MSNQLHSAPVRPPKVLQIGMTRAATCRNHFRRLLDEHKCALYDLHWENEKLLNKLYGDRVKYNKRIRALDEFTESLAGEDLPRDYAKWARLWDAIGKYYKEQLSRVCGEIYREMKAFRRKEKELMENIRSLKASIRQMNAVICD